MNQYSKIKNFEGGPLQSKVLEPPLATYIICTSFLYTVHTNGSFKYLLGKVLGILDGNFTTILNLLRIFVKKYFYFY
jgi:hypothetical protein